MVSTLAQNVRDVGLDSRSRHNFSHFSTLMTKLSYARDLIVNWVKVTDTTTTQSHALSHTVNPR